MAEIRKDDPRFHAVLDASDPAFAEKLADALGLEPGETVEFITPQFDRTDGVKPVVAGFEFSNLPSYSEEALRAFGCCPWDEPDEHGEVLWLFPAEWYDRIPEGHIVMDINGEEEPFRRGVTDDDRRFGCLAYGFMRHAPPATPTDSTGQHGCEAKRSEQKDPSNTGGVEPAGGGSRPCTCAPDDAPPLCMGKYAAIECQRAFAELGAPTHPLGSGQEGER